jgi:GNAT superfamily N-acetyltransferase
MTATARMALIGLVFEPIQEADEAFVLDSWVRSYVPKAPTAHEWARGYRNEQVIAKRCLLEGSTIMAVIPGYGRQLAGWINFDGPTVSYVYVKNLFRGQDIGSALLEHALGESKIACYTHDTPGFQSLLRSFERTHPNAEFRHADQASEALTSKQGSEAGSASQAVRG